MNWLSKSDENSDGFYRSSHSPLAIRVDLHAEACVNPAHFAEAASKSSSSEAGRSYLRKELAAANQDFAASAFNDRDLIQAVPGLNDQLFHVLHVVNLHAICPWVLRPLVEVRSCRNGFLLLHCAPLQFRPLYQMLREACLVSTFFSSLPRSLVT